jgi:hypothetical protein
MFCAERGDHWDGLVVSAMSGRVRRDKFHTKYVTYSSSGTTLKAELPFKLELPRQLGLDRPRENRSRAGDNADVER